MSDPLFGSMEFGGAAPLFGGDDDAFAPNSGPFVDGATAFADIDLDPEIICGLVPWHGGAFALLVPEIPSGTITVSRGRVALAVLAQTRLLRTDGSKTLVVVAGTTPAAGGDALILSVSGDGGTSHRPLRPTPAPFDRTLATLLGQAMARLEQTETRRNWQPLLRHLATTSELGVRADLSLPVGPGLALVLDGDLGATEEQPLAFALDGGQLTATKARLALDPETGRSIILLPVQGARYFVMLDDGLVDVSCPPGATRSAIARAPAAMALRASEAEVLLDLVAELGLEIGPRVPDWLPIAHALGWRGTDGGSIALVGAVAVEAGTVLFLASDDREHELGTLVVRDVSNAAERLFDAARPIAAFHPDAERHPGRLHLVLLLPRRLGAGALHLSLAGKTDGGGWVRTMDAGATRTEAILRAWLPPEPADATYVRIVAASVRARASRVPVVVVGDEIPDRAGTAETVILLFAFDADAAAIERTLQSVPVAVRRSIPIVIVLRSSDPDYDRTLEHLATTASTPDLAIATLVLAGPCGPAAALSLAVTRLQAAAFVLLDAGARLPDASDRHPVFERAGSADDDTLLLASGGDPPSGAVVSREVLQRSLGATDHRLATLPAALADIARVAAEGGGDVVRPDEFAVEPDALRQATFDALVDRALVTDLRPAAAHRGTA